MYAAECKSYHKVFHVFYRSFQQSSKVLLQSSSNAGSNFNIKIREDTANVNLFVSMHLSIFFSLLRLGR